MGDFLNIQKLKGLIVERETTQENVAHEIGIDRTTFYRKMKNGSFTVKEAKMIANVLPLSKDEAIEIFFN